LLQAKFIDSWKDIEQIVTTQHRIVLITYQQMLLSIESLSQFKWQHIFLDESQKIKNSNKTHAAALTLQTVANGSRWLASGTHCICNIIVLSH